MAISAWKGDARLAPLLVAALIAACDARPPSPASVASLPAPSPSRAPAAGLDIRAYTSTLETLRVEPDGRLARYAVPDVDLAPQALRTVRVHPSKRWLLALAKDSDGIWSSVLTVPLDGAGVPDIAHRGSHSLASLPGETNSRGPYGAAAPRGLLAAAFSPAGDHVYVARARYLGDLQDCHGPGALTAHAFDVARGSVGAASAPANVATDPVDLLVDPTDVVYTLGHGDTAGLYGPCGSGGVTGHELHGAATPSRMAGSPFEKDVVVLAGALAGGRLFVREIDFDAAYLRSNHRIAVWASRPDGSTGRLGVLDVSATRRGGAMAAHPSGRLLYLWLDGRIRAYAISDAGLAPLGAIDAPELRELFMTPDGRFLYGLGLPGAGVFGYAVEETTGALEPLRGSPFLAETFVDGGWAFATYP